MKFTLVLILLIYASTGLSAQSNYIDCESIPFRECMSEVLKDALQESYNNSACYQKLQAKHEATITLTVTEDGTLVLLEFESSVFENCKEQLEIDLIRYTIKQEVDPVLYKGSTEDGENFYFIISGDSISIDKSGSNKVFKKVEQMPLFGGCSDRACSDEKLIKYIQSNVKYPAEAREQNIQGRVFIRFVVRKDGTTSDHEIVRNIGAGCGKAALKVMKTMQNWQPAYQGGKPVSVYYTLPATFKLEG